MSSGNGQTPGRLLGLWWISWFGVIVGFIFIAGIECRREFSVGSPALVFSAFAVIAVLASWAAFFFCENGARRRDATVVKLLTTMGTIIAGMSVLLIFYFVAIAPRVQ
jgi:hypothetical protein